MVFCALKEMVYCWLTVMQNRTNLHKCYFRKYLQKPFIMQHNVYLKWSQPMRAKSDKFEILRIDPMLHGITGELSSSYFLVLSPSQAPPSKTLIKESHGLTFYIESKPNLIADLLIEYHVRLTPLWKCFFCFILKGVTAVAISWTKL